jgi:hypothetical protein
LPRLSAQDLRTCCWLNIIPNYDEEINEKSEEGKILMKNADLNVMAYTEWILLIEERINSREIIFRIIIKGCKSREYNDQEEI